MATKEMMNLPSAVSSLCERTTDMSAELFPALNVFSIKSLVPYISMASCAVQGIVVILQKKPK